MNDLAGREYEALRETIKSRGGIRPIAALVGLFAWATLLVGTLSWAPNPIAASVPLLVLTATFEIVRTLHLIVERIGRYLQVFYEEQDGPDAPLSPPCWERAAMAFGPHVPGAGGHPFFLPLFLMATLLNMLGVILPAPQQEELVAMTVPHIAFIVWMLYCDRAMRRQRTTELARYRAMKSGRA
jgi:hypothetical protein